MPLICFWATQTAVAALNLCAGIGWLSFKPYLPPIMAATVIQCTFCSFLNDESEWPRKLSWALKRNMNWAVHNLLDINNLVFSLYDNYWLHQLENR